MLKRQNCQAIRSGDDDSRFLEQVSDDRFGFDLGCRGSFPWRFTADCDRGPQVGIFLIFGSENPKCGHCRTAVLAFGFHATVKAFFRTGLKFHDFEYASCYPISNQCTFRMTNTRTEVTKPRAPTKSFMSQPPTFDTGRARSLSATGSRCWSISRKPGRSALWAIRLGSKRERCRSWGC